MIRSLSLRQIIVAAGCLIASAGFALMLGSNRYDLTILGIVFFSIAAVLVCKLEDLGG